MKVKNNITSEVQRKPNYLVTILVVLLLAIGTLALYEGVPKIIKQMDDKKAYGEDLFENDYFVRNLENFSFINAVKLLSKEENKENDSFLDLSNVAEQDKEYIKRVFADYLQTDLLEFYKNLQYYVYEPSSKQNITNQEELDVLLTATDPKKELLEYQFLAIIKYDENGSVSIDYVRGEDPYFFEHELEEAERVRQNELIDRLEESGNNDYEESGDSTFTRPPQNPHLPEHNLIKPIKNMTFIYGIPKELKYSDGISEIIAYQQYQMKYSVSSSLLYILLGAMAAFALLAFLMPYKFAKNGVFARELLRWNIEVILGLLCLAGVVAYCVTVYSVWVFYDSSYTIADLAFSSHPNFQNGVKLAGFFLSLSAAYLSVVLLKHIFHEGVFSYLKNRSLLVRSIIFVIRKIKKCYHVITSLDFSERGVKKIILLLGIHTIITVGLCCMWFIGIPFAILYHILIAVVLLRKYKVVKDHYTSLLNAAKNITTGELDTSIEEEMSVFNPVRDEMNRLREGLKHAVEEEVKSQNMKTELITNVSHDLKTPLTSIITYVDLLKNNSLTEEERAEYIAILDAKSQRLKVLIEDLFEMSKTTSKSLVLSYQNIDLVTLLKEILVEFEDKLTEASLQVKTDYQVDQAICTLDSEKTYRVFENLFGNITKYAMSNTRVYMMVSKTDKEAVVTIKNISHTEISYQGDQLFERFVRGDLSRNTEGSGLGLAIAKGLTEAQGGMIGIEVDGDLFKVTVRFPLSTHIEQKSVEIEK